MGNEWVVHCHQDPYDVFIGRPSDYGNPFRIGIDGTRREVIERHENYLYIRPDLIRKIRKELPGKVLGCFCAPLSCHGDLLVRIANGYQLPPLEDV